MLRFSKFNYVRFRSKTKPSIKIPTQNIPDRTTQQSILQQNATKRHSNKTDAKTDKARFSSDHRSRKNYKIINSQSEFGEDRSQDTIMRHGETLQRWETRLNRQGKPIWRAKYWNEEDEKFDTHVDLRAWKDMPEREKLWHKHTNSLRYRHYRSLAHQEIMREVTRIRDRTKLEFGTITYGKVINADESKNILTPAQKMQIIAYSQSEPGASLDLMASKFRVTPEVIRYVLKDKPEFEEEHDVPALLSPKRVFAESNQGQALSLKESYDEASIHPDFQNENKNMKKNVQSKEIMKIKNNPFLKGFG